MIYIYIYIIRVYYYMLWMMRRHFKVAEYQAPITAKSWAHVKLVVGLSQFLHNYPLQTLVSPFL